MKLKPHTGGPLRYRARMYLPIILKGYIIISTNIWCC